MHNLTGTITTPMHETFRTNRLIIWFKSGKDGDPKDCRGFVIHYRINDLSEYENIRLRVYLVTSLRLHYFNAILQKVIYKISRILYLRNFDVVATYSWR